MCHAFLRPAAGDGVTTFPDTSPFALPPSLPPSIIFCNNQTPRRQNPRREREKETQRHRDRDSERQTAHRNKERAAKIAARQTL